MSIAVRGKAGQRASAATQSRDNPGVVMQLDAVLGAFAGLMLSGLLIMSREDCAQWVLAHFEGSPQLSPPVSGAVTGTGIFFAIASLWLLVGCLH